MARGAFIFHLIQNTCFKLHFKILNMHFYVFYIINSVLLVIQVNRANMHMCNFANYYILPYSISTFKLNGSA